MWKDFKTFISKGNVLDLAVAVVIGAAFGKIVTSLVNDILMPPIGLLLGKVDFSNLFINLSGKSNATLEAAKAAGAPTINYGRFINSVIDFLIIATVIFLLVRSVVQIRNKLEPPTGPTMKECPYCISNIPIKASRCPNCTSELQKG